MLGAACTAALLAGSDARAEVTPQRTWSTLVSSNGHGAVVVDFEPGSGAQIHHFREHIFATEEPQIDASGNDIFESGYPQSVYARDLLYDTYFGLRANGDQRWVKSLTVDLDASGFEGTTAGATGGTGIIRMIQRWGDLEITQYIFAPFGLEHAGFAMIAKVRNTGFVRCQRRVGLHASTTFTSASAVRDRIRKSARSTKRSCTTRPTTRSKKRGFAGVVVTRALGGSSHHGASNSSSSASQNVWQIVENGGATDLPDLSGEAPTANGSVSAFQHEAGSLAAGAEAWFGVVSTHHGDPFGADTVEGWLDSWVAGRTPEQIVGGRTGLVGHVSSQASRCPRV